MAMAREPKGISDQSLPGKGSSLPCSALLAELIGGGVQLTCKLGGDEKENRKEIAYS